jgi:hypothetical protein
VFNLARFWAWPGFGLSQGIFSGESIGEFSGKIVFIGPKAGLLFLMGTFGKAEIAWSLT